MFYQIVTVNGGTGDWNKLIDMFEADNDSEANFHAEKHFPDLEWYVLNEDGENINS